MNSTMLRVISDNSDWSGDWKKSDVKREMNELGITGSWIEYILEHALEDASFMTSDIEKLISENLKYGKLEFITDGVKTVIELC